MDIKLDFAPPSLINFISRQLIGSGFRLYQKVVDSFYVYFFYKALDENLFVYVLAYNQNQDIINNRRDLLLC